ncbi:hypothetical protein GYMLUDRAFT_33467 [Collybiopsis luxurians FD-317 M1]|nr:hypothetical protein GYMLUDRAFT_33467 [Collybiopsis luxurians FD-317 M1]
MPASNLSMEEEKLNYSRQLAEYTLRQWNSIYREQGKATRPADTRRKSSTMYLPPRPQDGSDTEEDTPIAKPTGTIQIVDYGKGLPRDGPRYMDKHRK